MTRQARYKRTKKGKKTEQRYRKADGIDKPGYWRARESAWIKHGITDASEETYKRMYKCQRGKCLLCHRGFPLVGDGTTQSLHLDHDHATGLSRGLLCRRCNFRLIGKIEGVRGRWGIDEPLFKRGLVYLLEKHSNGGRDAND